MNFSREFLDSFSAYFMAELLDAETDDELRETARACAAAYSGLGKDLAPVINSIDALLQTWDTAAILELVNASNVDWLDSEEKEAELSVVLDQLVTSLRRQRLARSEASEVQAGAD